MKTYGEWQASGDLYLPKQVVESHQEQKDILLKRFKNEFDSFLDKHKDEKEPFFVLYKASFDELDPSCCRQAFSYYAKRPPIITRTLVFWIDNVRGIALPLWQVREDGKVNWNTDGVSRLGNIYRGRVSA